MKALISQWNAVETCVWCEKDKECVTVEFGDGFLRNSALCWRCLQKAVRVRAQQSPARPSKQSDTTT